jgi:5-carboxymethyl-2-hydroxymuconate isomerase
MPHIICHYSAEPTAQIHNVIDALHRAAVASNLARSEDYKIRAQAFSDYSVGGARKSFFHVTTYMHVGRTMEQKAQFSESLLKALVGALPEFHSLSIDIRDMDRSAYRRRVLVD